jgi:hypothetical protein
MQPRIFDQNGRLVGNYSAPAAPSKNLLQQIGDYFASADRTFRGVSELTNKAGGFQGQKFLSDEEKRIYKEDPMNIIKDIASTASFIVPGGGGIKAAIGAGALSGLGGTYGESDLGKTLMGTAVGGATGGALGIVGKGIAAASKGKLPKFLQNAGKKYENKAITDSVQPNRFNVLGIQQGEELGEKVANNIRNRIGKVTKEGMGDAYKLAGEEYNSLISSSKLPIPTQNLSTRAIERAGLTTDITKGVAKNNIEVWNNRLASIGENATPQQLSQIKFDLLKDLGNAFKKQQLAKPLTSQEKVLMSYHDTVDDALKKALPEARPILEEMSQYHAAAPDVIKAFNKGESLPVPFTFGKVEIPGGKIKDAFTGTIGRALQGVPAGTQRGSISKGAEGIGSLMQNPKLAAIFTPLLQGTGQAAPALAESEMPQSEVMASESSSDEGGEIARQLAAGGMKPSEIKTLQDIGAIPKPKSEAKSKLTEGEKKFSAAGQQAQQALQLLESGDVSTGFLPSIGNKVSGFFDAQSPVQTDYLSKLAAARGSAVSALSGANVPEGEYARIAALIPEENDEPRKAAQKLRSFIEAMKVYSSQ